MIRATWTGLACMAVLATLLCGGVQAVTYEVNRSFPGVSLVGTVDVPLGNYVIQSSGAYPFTSIDLLLTADSIPYQLTHAFTDIDVGTGKFIVDATPTTLTFGIADADPSNPAAVVFGETLDDQRYVLGSAGLLEVEVAFIPSGSLTTTIAFPLVFGTAVVPEPSALGLAAGALFGVGAWRRSRTR
jgi:hypothetical protein